MNKLVAVILIMIFITLACVSTPPTANPVNIEAAIVGTQTAAQAQLTIMPTPTSKPTQEILARTEFPLESTTMNYEGVTIDCTCIGCYCYTATDVVFLVTLIIGSDGYITGTFKKYLPEIPDIELTGTKANFSGSYKGDITNMEFVGELSNDLRYIKATLSFSGENEDGSNFTGKRILLLEKKEKN